MAGSINIISLFGRQSGSLPVLLVYAMWKQLLEQRRHCSATGSIPPLVVIAVTRVSAELLTSVGHKRCRVFLAQKGPFAIPENQQSRTLCTGTP